MDKEQYYQHLKKILTKAEFMVNPYRDIQYGIQFMVFYHDNSGLLRIYHSKKGIRLDYSQLTDDTLKSRIQETIAKAEDRSHLPPTLPKAFKKAQQKNETPNTYPDTLIGVDESGKGDYFGPLVVAGVHICPKTTETLTALGVKDSKLLFDKSVTFK